MKPEYSKLDEFASAPRWPLKISAACVAVGALFLFVKLGRWSFAGAWLELALSLGLLALGGAGICYFSWRGVSLGIRHDGIMFSRHTARGWPAWALAVFLTLFYVMVYWDSPWLAGWIELVAPLSFALRNAAPDRWFLYGVFYTLAVLVMGIRMLMKYRHDRYHLIRTGSVMFFQLGFAFLLPQLMAAFQQPEFYFSYFWPLSHRDLFPDSIHGLLAHPGGLGKFLVLWGLLCTFVAVPLLTYFFGKRWYCSWVCGCGGLAETVGDPYRQLSSKSDTAWRIERVSVHSVLVLVVLITGVLWVNQLRPFLGGVAGELQYYYGLFIGSIFSGVIGVGLYPLLGSRVWCRFGCPLAAVLGILQRSWSRFRITTNGDQCISCGNCSTYCEMGIDVRAYAQRGEDIVRASCVGCGVCSSVCPRGVLKLENGPRKLDSRAGVR